MGASKRARKRKRDAMEMATGKFRESERSGEIL